MKYQNKILEDGICIDDAIVSREKAMAIQTLLSADNPAHLAPKTIPFIIERNGHRLRGKVKIIADGVEIYFDNYGMKEVERGEGGVVFAEPGDDGHPVIRVWACIAEADPTHTIALDEAAEHWRDGGNNPNSCQCELCSHSG